MSLEVFEVIGDKLKEKIQAGTPEPAFFKSFLSGAHPPLAVHYSGFCVSNSAANQAFGLVKNLKISNIAIQRKMLAPAQKAMITKV